MSCSCHLCEPWNILAREADDAERLNELQQQRLALHGLKPAPKAQESAGPNVLTKRRVVQRDGRTVVIDEGFDLTNADDREKIRQMLAEAEAPDFGCPTVERTFPPPPKRTPRITPIVRDVLKAIEEQRLREYLRSRL